MTMENLEATSEWLIHHFFLYGVNAVSIVITVVALRRHVPRRASWIWLAAALLGMAFIGRSIYFFQTTEGWGSDFGFMWRGGARALQGEDPYTLKGFKPPNEDLVTFCYPPFVLPWFKLFALVPLPTAQVVWMSLNILICLSLGFMARQALIAQDGEQSAKLCPSMTALLTASVLLSLSTHFAMQTGQIAFLETAVLLGALTAQMRHRSALAALCLAVASIKIQTMLPFLLLFLGRRDIRTWLFLCLMGAALLLAAGDPADLPRKFSAFFEVNASLRAPGGPADNSMLNLLTNTMFGFQHLFYRLGVVDDQTVSALALTCMLGLGCWLAYVISIKRTLARGACCSLVSLYSMLFIYHRTYDLSILMVPLFYGASRLHVPSRAARWCYIWVVAAILMALNAPYGELLRIQVLYSSSPFLRIAVLPSITYLILSAMAALVAAASFEARHESMRHVWTESEEGPKQAVVAAEAC
jgi:hypothetical protein